MVNKIEMISRFLTTSRMSIVGSVTSTFTCVSVVLFSFKMLFSDDYIINTTRENKIISHFKQYGQTDSKQYHKSENLQTPSEK